MKNEFIRRKKIESILFIPEIREYHNLGKFMWKGFSLGKKINT